MLDTEVFHYFSKYCNIIDKLEVLFTSYFVALLHSTWSNATK